MKVKRQAAQLAFTVAQPGVAGGKRGVVMEQGLEEAGEQTLELYRSPVHGLSNARIGTVCTHELRQGAAYGRRY
jgi:hypothetical protein